ncbi:RbsD/FucU family protein [Halothermothrix orenii]|uniref:RbsD or FucU transport n=1 Tax=Halothermothrix orenii (strain H 168 / OCM 544 / DSM 9562) TaxID=373903 RepID=B8CWP6_HALOH|nr:RbsD/FucU family protein [Halothermothrix orenii]ACL69715.1 RbsD or FucU transport [Halothermothrix orenii H 168]
MVKGGLIHPHILESVAAAGHGAQILITDGNYPASTKTKEDVNKVYLNLAPGLVNVTDVLKVLVEVINIEEATVMAPSKGDKPAIFKEFKRILSSGTDFNEIGRFEFYDKCVSNQDLCLVIVTGEQRIYANILLTIGVVK